MALTVIKTSGVDLSSDSVTVETLYRGNLPIVCDDISTQFDGVKSVFQLRQNQASINNVVDSKDVQVTVNGQILAPYVTELRYPWIIEYESFKGFKIVGSNLYIPSAPEAGDTAVVMITNTSLAKQYRKYPYSAMSIAIGD